MVHAAARSLGACQAALHFLGQLYCVWLTIAGSRPLGRCALVGGAGQALGVGGHQCCSCITRAIGVLGALFRRWNAVCCVVGGATARDNLAVCNGLLWRAVTCRQIVTAVGLVGCWQPRWACHNIQSSFSAGAVPFLLHQQMRHAVVVESHQQYSQLSCRTGTACRGSWPQGQNRSPAGTGCHPHCCSQNLPGSAAQPRTPTARWSSGLS